MPIKQSSKQKASERRTRANGMTRNKTARQSVVKKKPRPSKAAGPKSRLTTADEMELQELQVKLEPDDRAAVIKILQGLGDHLGSLEAGRFWLTLKSPEFGMTPLQAIRNGKAKLVLATLEERWGRNPIYA